MRKAEAGARNSIGTEVQSVPTLKELREFLWENLPELPVIETLAALEEFDPDCVHGNLNFRRRMQYLILHIVNEEKVDLAHAVQALPTAAQGLDRVVQLVNVANDNYKYLYLISAQELFFLGD